MLTPEDEAFIRKNWQGTGEDRDLLLGEIDRLREKLDIAVKALEHYANPDYWTLVQEVNMTKISSTGETAREALAKIRGEK